MGKLFLVGLLLCLTWAQEKCNYREKFLTQSKVNEFIHEHNRIRDEVALGKMKNPDGKFQSAANMNYIIYNQDLARRAQDCADRCPLNNMRCYDISVGNGVLTYEGDIYQGGADWFPKRVMYYWTQNPTFFRQIVEASVTRFGCGRVQSENKAILKEVVVCFYDVKTNTNHTPYTYGPTLSRCVNGRKQGYLGLCDSGRRNFIQHGHTIKDGKKKTKNALTGNKKNVKKSKKQNQKQAPKKHKK